MGQSNWLIAKKKFELLGEVTRKGIIFKLNILTMCCCTVHLVAISVLLLGEEKNWKFLLA
jgi:hypothetical protein